MSHLGLMSPKAKGNSWAPHADSVGLRRRAPDLIPALGFLAVTMCC